MPALTFVALTLCLSWTNRGALLRDVDTDFQPTVSSPTFLSGAGPRVLIDAAHHNFHTAPGRFKPLADLLRADGYRLGECQSRFDAASLGQADLLIVANALHAENVERWEQPTPSAFTDDEINAVRGWVERGGRLLLIADHTPFGGAAAELAGAFGVEFHNAYAWGPGHDRPSIDLFTPQDGTLADHPAVHGSSPSTAIRQVATFSGQAFDAKGPFVSLLQFPAESKLLLSPRANGFDAELPRRSAEGWSQGAVAMWGTGRVAMFGEAAMFSAQRLGLAKRKLGMNHPAAKQNSQFVLNLTHWLTAR